MIIGSLLSDPARVAIMMALAGGEALRPGELAKRAAVAPSTASFHLAKLMDAGWIVHDQQAAIRRYKLASPEVAEILEHLAYVAPPAPVSSLRGHQAREALREARCCYDHMAGTLGVSLTQALLRQDVLRACGDHFQLTADGGQWLRNRAMSLPEPGVDKRAFARPCLDWTERGCHLAGRLSAAILTHWTEHGYVIRPEKARSLRVTSAGHEQLIAWGITKLSHEPTAAGS
ncbi:MAG TPA: winged helix-turn-helix domain-containing protein [Solirubrobacteraceae bacterium]